MSRVLVTGAAGFIGSHLAEHLALLGHEVVAVDCLTPYYAESSKRANLSAVLAAGCEVHEVDLATTDLDVLFDGIETIFHLAGQPGVRLSWSSGFPEYDRQNVAVTQLVLEGALRSGVERLVYSSSSSVYGDAERFPTSEAVLPRPVSPYGVTKLAGEHLTGLYGRVHGLSTVSLRYFTVYGPRQRPDMAFHRIIESVLGGATFELFGDGMQVRDFTYVGDVVEANVAAMSCDGVEPGAVFNVSGGSAVDMRTVLELIAEVSGVAPRVELAPAQPGDARRTGGDGARAREVLGWSPGVSLRDGLSQQVEWHRSRRSPGVQ